MCLLLKVLVFCDETLSSLKVLLVMLLVTKPISSLKETISDKKMSSLKKKTKEWCGVSTTNLDSSVKASNSDETPVVTIDVL